MPESVPTSLSSFVVILIGSSAAVMACGVLVAFLTHRYRKQAIDLARRYLGAKDERHAVVHQLERTLGQVALKNREVSIVQQQAQSAADLSSKLQERVLALESKSNDLVEHNLDLQARLNRAEIQLGELEQLATKQQSLLGDATSEVNAARAELTRAQMLAADRGRMVGQLEQRLKDAQAQLQGALKTSADAQAAHSKLQERVASFERRIADSQRAGLQMELQLASQSERFRVADKAAETHQQHVQTIDTLRTQLQEARGKLDAIERDRSNASQPATFNARTAAVQVSLERASAESRDRLGIIQQLTDDLNATRLAMRNAQMLADQHEALHREHALRAGGALAARPAGPAAAAADPVPASFDAAAPDEAPTLEEQSVIARASALPGSQTLLKKLAAMLVSAQRELESSRRSPDEAASPVNAPPGGAPPGGAPPGGARPAAAEGGDDGGALRAQLADAQNKLAEARARQSEQSGKISTLMRDMNDLQRRYESSKALADDLRRTVSNVDRERQTLEAQLQEELKHRQTPPPDAASLNVAPSGLAPLEVPRFVATAIEAPRFVQHDERITIDAPLESIKGLNAKDINLLRAAAIMTAGDLAALSVDRLQTIIRPTLLRRPEYESWLRQARQMNGDTPDGDTPLEDSVQFEAP